MKQYNIFYQGRKIFNNLDAEECAEVIQELSERFYSEENFDPTLIEMEEI